MNSKLVSKFWLVSASFLLSLAWLIPNHNPPWVSFHGDAWAASLLTVVGMWVTWKSKANTGWQVFTLAVAFLCLMPWLQYALGLIPIWGTAWMSGIYLLGLLFAIQTGEQWEKASPGQCADFVFLAVMLAAVVSTGLQLHQAAGLEPFGIWTLYVSGQSRFYANMAQPNQLASLLLLGLLGCSWGFYRGKLNAWVALCVSCFILFGVVLTESRTAWLNLSLLLIGAVTLRAKLPSHRYLLAVAGLGLYFFMCVLLLPLLAAYIHTGVESDYRSLADPIRLGAWRMLLEASMLEPFLGFGWGQVGAASLLVAVNFPGHAGLFAQAHNIFLDLVLWNGYPLGLLLVALICWWAWKAISLVRSFEQLHLLAFVTVLGTHAMLEYPLQYAFFLLPFGLMVGALQTSLGFEAIFKGQKWIRLVIAVMAAIALTITVRDYFRVETSFYGLRFEHRKIQTDIPSTPPNVIALTQFRDHLKFARNVPRTGVPPRELAWMIDTVNTMPSALVIYKLAANLAMNERPVEAKEWLVRLCKTMAAVNCSAMKIQWEQEGMGSSEIASVQWPQE